MKTILPFCKAFVLLIASYFVFAVLSCLLPDQSINKNIKESAEKLVNEGLYPKAIISLSQCQMDNFTDALIMNQICSIDRSRPVRSAMRVYRSSEQGRDWDQTGLLFRKMNGEDLDSHHYARYWHGNTFLFRFFFLVMDFNTIRWTLFVVSGMLMVMLICAFYQKAGLVKTLALSSGFLVTCGFVTQFSMQFFPVLALTLIGCLLVIKRIESKNLGMLLFVIGSLTCYFDLLTAPLLTLGMPLAVLLSLNEDNPFKLKDNFINLAKLTLLWGLGFALTFFTKWVLATLILGQNILADAYNTGLYRMEAEEFTRWDALSRNFKMIQLWMIVVAVVLFIIFNVLKHKKFNYKKAVLFVLIGLAPYVWYLILSNHSYLHWWFTYRIQAITIACLLLMLAEPFTQKYKIQ